MSQPSAFPQPRKRFGQNFLHDASVIARIIQAFAPQPKQQIVEIGAGRGALTLPLLELLGQLSVVEIDRDLATLLQQTCAPLGKLTLYQADALKFDFGQLAQAGQSLRIIGNLPYNISTPLLFHLLEFTPCISDMLFMLQKEVVDRMTAAPDTANYGRLSVALQYRCQVEKLFDVGSGAFTPAPKVESSIVQLIPYQTLPCPANDEAVFQRVITSAFAQRRKTLRNNLKNLLSDTQIQQMGIDPQTRAETLDVADFVRLANCLSESGLTELKDQKTTKV
ncbi:16S rRNA (adenine(1518)-N(6)/adenine(1519)-N(6))-dimethyltransferase RsmA [Beggiatoa leptomitoformis]|uniref:Ribosomal RNA small subunit methyltransferase A n=1 Tax=Beggiatoa leptomitoformis TaxID=288004 RepID=A0A2N9YFK6_9GAMM|nr:16S rRNA (adenine(1518)-N(6)/adenine(1519)-N(6))-dimethyltransferase RsmA [Beggiatoa leptomitoformis]ALG68520.1 16S rRNA (adenine(1518)-N(6)/adenine(1519)-N(6))-dimethyltransferase RsmA [Beggiatoa leptomitoformis]AUI69139.1 16S rRNA (adenine(1518)-N(6)/adenine(1519)-N(6))-dimethyltransferase RsmA [Beggiatoa leptomitoformis]